tara:strand:- start:206 stop:577 length:372 start_codon:yes stop_codon:yes gene_type:complete
MSEYTGFGNGGYDADAEGEESTFNADFYNQNNPTKFSKQIGGYLMDRFESAFHHKNNAIANIFKICDKCGNAELKESKIPIQSHQISGVGEAPQGFEVRAEPEGSRHSREGVYSIKTQSESGN